MKFDPKGPCGKVMYKSEELAMTRAFYLNAIHPVLHGKPFRTYLCPTCKAFHLTSQPPRTAPPNPTK